MPENDREPVSFDDSGFQQRELAEIYGFECPDNCPLVHRWTVYMVVSAVGANLLAYPTFMMLAYVLGKRHRNALTVYNPLSESN
jgi:hypothetical protein